MIYNSRQGSALIIVFFLVVVFTVIVIAGMRLVALETNQVTNQKLHDQTFHLAEAGIHYAAHELGTQGIKPKNLRNVEDYEVTDPLTEQVIGVFDVEYDVDTNQGVTTITATATGSHHVKTNFKEIITAQFQTTDEETYTLISWHHLP